MPMFHQPSTHFFAFLYTKLLQRSLCVYHIQLFSTSSSISFKKILSQDLFKYYSVLFSLFSFFGRQLHVCQTFVPHQFFSLLQFENFHDFPVIFFKTLHCSWLYLSSSRAVLDSQQNWEESTEMSQVPPATPHAQPPPLSTSPPERAVCYKR